MIKRHTFYTNIIYEALTRAISGSTLLISTFSASFRTRLSISFGFDLRHYFKNSTN